MKWILFILLLPVPMLTGSLRAIAQNTVAIKVRPEGGVKPDSTVRQKRLEAYFAAYVSWIDRHCSLSENQQEQIDKAINSKIKKAQQFYSKPSAKIEETEFLYDYSPLNFVEEHGSAQKVFRTGIENEISKILNQVQRGKWQAAKVKREQELHNVFVERVIGIANQRLFLSEEEKQQIRGLFPSQYPLLKNATFSYTPRSSYVYERSIVDLLSHQSLPFKKAGREKLIRGPLPKDTIIQSTDSYSVWVQVVEEAVETQKRLYQRMLNARVAHLVSDLHISPEGERYLQIAAKGIVTRDVAQWKKNAMQELKRWEEYYSKNPGQDVSLEIYALDTTRYYQMYHSIWNLALKKVVPASSWKARHARSHEELIKYVAAVIDQEVWLSSGQREKIIQLYQNSDFKDLKRYRGRHYHLTLIGTALHSIDQKKFGEILNITQLKALAELKNQFQTKHGFLAIKTRYGEFHL